MIRSAHRRALPALAVAGAAGLALVPAAGADSGRYVARTLTQRASDGLAVSGPLSAYRAVARARVVVPAEWSALRAPSGQLGLITRGTASCRYRVAFTVAVRMAPSASDPAAHLAAAIPAPGPRNVLDGGRRGASAFRVVKRQGVPATVDAGWTAPLTRRADVVPAGQTAWVDVTVRARARAGDECHSGTWREALGPQLGDAMATARASLRFVRPSGGRG